MFSMFFHFVVSFFRFPVSSSEFAMRSSSNNQQQQQRSRNCRIVSFQEDSGRFWREESEDGALYHVELKKVVYNSFPDVSSRSCFLRHKNDTFCFLWESMKKNCYRNKCYWKILEFRKKMTNKNTVGFVEHRTFVTLQKS